MTRYKLIFHSMLLVVLLLAGMSQVIAAENLLTNPTFKIAQEGELPIGWKLYGNLERGSTITLVEVDNPSQVVLHILDANDERQLGLFQTVPGKSGTAYRLTAMVKAVPGATTTGTNLQMRFMPAGERINVSLSPYLTNEFTEVVVNGMAPDGTTEINVYIWTATMSTSQMMVGQVELTEIDF